MTTEQNPSRKLTVEICNARNLMPKDGQGTASAYVQVDFAGQRRRTKTINRDLNPQWDERLEFMMHDSESIASETLELNLYNDKPTGKRTTFLGKVRISGSSFEKAGSESLVYYPLEKRSVFSQVKGEIGVKVWYVEEEAPLPPPPAEEKAEAPQPPTEDKPPEKVEDANPPAAEEGSKKEQDQDGQQKQEDQEKKPESHEPEKKEDNPPEEQKKEEETSHPAQQPAAPVDQPFVVQQKPHINKQMSEKSSELKVIPSLSGSGIDRRNSTFDLVDQMPFLYIRIVKVKLVNAEADSTAYAKLVIGTHSLRTKSLTPAVQNREWDQVFAFDKDGLNSTSLELSIWVEKKVADDKSEESCIGIVSFDLPEVPKRLPSDSPLAPQWYSLESNQNLSFPENEVMLSVWIGTQADEAFNEAWQSDSGGLVSETRAKVYLSPKLWYLRLTVIQTQDLKLGSGSTEAKFRNPELYVKGQLGAQLFKTSRTTFGSSSSASNPTWNEDLIFVAAEPFEPFLTITVEDASNGHPVGHAQVHVASIDRLTDDKSEPRSRWFNLVVDGGENKEYAGRIHVRLGLEGGYHVLDEPAHVTSDVRATAKQLSKPPIGLLELGIRGAANLLPVKTKDGTRGTTDAYVVAKYGPKWVRTRTIVDRFNPRWNEQYTWEVYDPCTVLTIGVFDNGRYKQENGNEATGMKDLRLGKLRVRLSTLDTNKVYAGTYSLMVLLPGGARKMGEIEIALRFTCSSWLSLIHAYGNPVLPRMHYVRPFGPGQQDILRHTAMRIVTARLARSEPALGQEVVQFMLDSDTHIWSVRRGKANWFRVVGCLSKVAAVARWLDGVRTWANPPTTVLVHILLVAIVLCPHLILPTICMYAFLIILMRFRSRQHVGIGMDSRLSYLDAVGPDELDEEFDGFPTTRSADQIRIRYDRLRALAGRAQTLLGDIAAQGERLEALFNWRDPRATGIFVVVCLLASLVFYLVPFKAFALGAGLYYLRHPRFRGDMPSIPVNFFRRLPSLSDQIL